MPMRIELNPWFAPDSTPGRLVTRPSFYVAPFTFTSRGDAEARGTPLIALRVSKSPRHVLDQNVPSLNVSHASILPLSRPRRSHDTRCSDEPWVKDSGTTRP